MVTHVSEQAQECTGRAKLGKWMQPRGAMPETR